MSIIQLVSVLMVAGVALYLVGLIPMAAPIPSIIRALVILAVVLWLLDAFFGLGWSLPAARHPLR